MVILKILLKAKNQIGNIIYNPMKNIFRLLAPLALALCGCVYEELPNNELVQSEGRIFTASLEQDETRTYVEEGNLLRWNAGDQISLFDGNTLNRQYKFDGESGDNSGTFSIVNAPYGSGNDLNANYAVYPYASDIKITEAGVITVTVPAEQNYAENSFGLGANTMVAVTENHDDTFLKFKNVGGYLKLQLYGDDVTVKSIELTGNSNEKIAGKASITPTYSDEPKISMSDDATSSITLNCGEGVKVGSTAENATAFWIVVPPTTFEGGFTITITDINGETFTKSTSNEIAIERNVIKPMKEFEGIFENEGSTIPNNQIWYTANQKFTPNYSGIDTYGANIVSNEWDSTTGNGVITFDGDVTKIGRYVFYQTYHATSITIPNSVTEIEDGAFCCCRDLISINIPNNVTSIGFEAFRESRNLTSIIIPNSVTTIGIGAFSYCTSLTSVTIGDGVTSIGNSAFSGCISLTGVTIPDSVTEIEKSTFRDCSSLTRVTIGNGVTSIGDNAFYSCKNLTSVTIGDSVKMIGNQAFYSCSSLTSVIIPDSVTEIDHVAFSSCSGLTSITISSNVTRIGSNAFNNCRSLISVYCKATTPPSLGGSYNGFDGNATDRKIYVPMESVNAYKSAIHWSEYSDAIIGYDF